jgi:hypothetical protein
MKKFITKIILFALLFLVFSLLFVSINISDSYVIYKTKGTVYDKVAYNLDVINSKPEKISNAIVFLGPSYVLSGISDQVLMNNGIKSINLAINHMGKDVELYFAKRVLNLKPKKIYIYANSECYDLHPMTALLYDPISLINSGQSINFSFLKDYLIKRIPFVMDYIKWELINKSNYNTTETEWGVLYIEDICTKNIYDSLKKIAEYEYITRENNFINQNTALQPIVGSIKDIIGYCFFNKGSQHRFLLNILSSANNTEIAGIYIPMLEDAVIPKETQNEKYFANTRIKIETLNDFRLLGKSQYWADKSHLSKEGSIYFTNELIKTGIFNIHESL